jgi:hypothetical protein
MRILDKSQVTGVESSGYPLPGSVVAAAALAMTVLLAVACRGGSHAAASDTSKPASRARQSVTTTEPPTSAPTTSSTTIGSGSALASKLLPSPPDIVSTQATNGPITPAQFDQNRGEKGAAASFLSWLALGDGVHLLRRATLYRKGTSSVLTSSAAKKAATWAG